MTDRFAAGANAWSLCDFAGHGIRSCPVGQGVAVVSDLGIHGGGLGLGSPFRILSACGATGWSHGARTSSAITEVALGWNAWLTNMMTRMDCGLQ